MLNNKEEQVEKTDEFDELMTMREAAAYFRVHYNTIRNWVHEGVLPAHKVVRHWRIKRSDAEALLPR